MDANQDEAMRCVALAAAALQAGEKARGERLLAKATRMNPNINISDALRSFTKTSPPQQSSTNKQTNTRKSAPAPAPETEPEAEPEPQREASEEMISDVTSVRRAGNDYYAVLGVEKDASAADLKRAYRRKVLALHPDKNVAPGAEDAFKIVAKAWETLSDAEKRRRYDMFGVTDDTPPQPTMMRRRRNQHNFGNSFVHVHTMNGDVDMDEIFAAMFGAPPPHHRRGGNFRRAQRPQPQQDVSPIFAMLWVFAILGTFSFVSFVMNVLQQLLGG